MKRCLVWLHLNMPCFMLLTGDLPFPEKKRRRNGRGGDREKGRDWVETSKGNLLPGCKITLFNLKIKNKNIIFKVRCELSIKGGRNFAGRCMGKDQRSTWGVVFRSHSPCYCPPCPLWQSLTGTWVTNSARLASQLAPEKTVSLFPGQGQPAQTTTPRLYVVSGDHIQGFILKTKNILPTTTAPQVQGILHKKSY